MSGHTGSQQFAFGTRLDTANEAERDGVYGFARIGAPTKPAEPAPGAAALSIDALLAARVPAPDLAPTLERIRGTVEHLASLPLVAGDGECLRLLGAMVVAPDMDAFHAVVEQLERHVGALLSGETTPVPAASQPSRPSASAGRPRLLLKL